MQSTNSTFPSHTYVISFRATTICTLHHANALITNDRLYETLVLMIWLEKLQKCKLLIHD